MKQRLLPGVIGLIAVAVVVFLMINSDSKPSSFDVKDGSLAIGGSFGVTVPLKEISGLALADSMPAVGTKTNGSGVGSVCKGEFTLKDGTKARLYADTAKPPFITFTQGGTAFYINLDTAEKTTELYEKLKAETAP